MSITSPLPRRALVAALALSAVAAAAGTLIRSDDPDLFHHLALGREIVRSGLFHDERLVFPTLGQPAGVAPYWLGSVVLYLWHALFGDAGLSFLPAAFGALLCALLLVDATPRSSRHSALTLAAATLPVALALEVFRYRAVPRPELFGALLLAWTMWAIRRFEEGRQLPLLLFPAVAALWTNLHPSTAVALGPLALLVASLAARAARARWRRTVPAAASGAATGAPVPEEGGPPGHVLEARAPVLEEIPGTAAAPGERSFAPAALAGAILLAGTLATALRPGFESTVTVALRFVLAAFGAGGGPGGPVDPGLRSVARSVLEMQGGGAALWTTPAGALIVLAGLSFLLAWRAARPRELLTVAAFAVLPFAAVRLALFFAVVAAPIAARNLGAALSRLPPRLGRVPAQAGAAALCAAAALASLPLGDQAAHIRFGAGIAWEAFPVRAADYLAAAGFRGRLFDTFHLGGYLEWRGVGPPYQDGRGSAPPEDQPGATTGPLDRAAFAPLDAKYRFDALVLAYPSVDPAYAQLVGPAAFSPDPARWALVAYDDGGLLYLRRDGRYADLAARDEFRYASPANAFLLQTPPAALPAVLADLRRSVVEAPRCIVCRYLEAEVALACGLPAEAASAAAAALPRAYGPVRDALASVAARAAAAGVPRRPGGAASP